MAEELSVLEDRIEVLHEQNRIYREVLETLLGAEEYTLLQELPEIANDVREEIEQATNRTYVEMADGGSGENRVDQCMTVTRQELRRKQERYGKKTSVEVSEIREIVDRDCGFYPEYKTVHDAFDKLASKDPRFEVEKGEPGPHTRNTRLLVKG